MIGLMHVYTQEKCNTCDILLKRNNTNISKQIRNAFTAFITNTSRGTRWGEIISDSVSDLYEI